MAGKQRKLWQRGGDETRRVGEGKGRKIAGRQTVGSKKLRASDWKVPKMFRLRTDNGQRQVRSGPSPNWTKPELDRSPCSTASARLAGGHLRSTAALKSCCHTRDPHGRHGSTPSPAFLNNEVAIVDSTLFDKIANGRRRRSKSRQ
jgi:hypothetical protein